ncbi:MAG: hypothetical protein GHCLOJNM_03427 [bacterium]|nr:hypothetical protein [bacterium]
MNPQGLTYSAIYCLRDAVIDGITFTTGRKANGGAIIGASATFRNCIIKENENRYVGGMLVRDGSAEFVNCVIRGNRSITSGGGLYIEDSNVTLRGCDISHNHATNGGGIVLARSFGYITNCTISNNVAEYGDSSAVGGIAVGTKNCIFVNCLISDNKADTEAQMNINQCEYAALTNCTIVGGPAELLIDRCTPIFENCILWGSSNLLSISLGQALITSSCIQGGYPGEGNISDDPLFIDATIGNFHLQPGSPCIDTAGTSGPSDDLDGNPRPADVFGLGREGTGDEYDMGAYEFQPPVPTPTPTETLLPTPTMNPASDINQSGKVDTEDLLLLIADWARGATP